MVSRKLLTNIRSHTIVFLYYLMAVLVAISIPIFTSQLEKSREATDVANIRSMYAGVMTDYLTDGSAKTGSVSAKQTQANWQTSPAPVLEVMYGASASEVSLPVKTNGQTWTIAIDTSGSLTIS